MLSSNEGGREMKTKDKSKLVFRLSVVFTALFLVIAASGLTPANAEGWKPKSIRIGTATAIASNYRLGGAIAQVLKDVLNMPVSSQETGGSAADCRLVSAKEAEAGIVVGPADYYAYTGTPPFKKVYRDLRAVMVVDRNPYQIVVLAESGIKSIPDLRGKRVGVGSVGSGQDVMARAVLGEFNMTYDDIKEAYRGRKLGDLLRDKEIDAFVSVIATPGGYITELSNAKPINLLPLPERVRNKLVGKYPFMTKTVLKKGVYVGVKENVPGLAAWSTWIVHKDLDDEIVYKTAKGILEGKDKIVAAYPGAKRFISPEHALKGIAIPLHPGARKYFEETKNPDLANVPK
jgi:TRAP transporter TAXI family solute receptor